MSSIKIAPDETAAIKNQSGSPKVTPRSPKVFLRALSDMSLKVVTWEQLPTLALVSGAVLSFADVIFDVIMVGKYRALGKDAFANGTIISIALSLTFQLIIVVAQNRKRGARVIARESVRSNPNSTPRPVATPSNCSRSNISARKNRSYLYFSVSNLE